MKMLYLTSLAVLALPLSVMAIEPGPPPSVTWRRNACWKATNTRFRSTSIRRRAGQPRAVVDSRTRSVLGGIPTQSVGTIIQTQVGFLWRASLPALGCEAPPKKPETAAQSTGASSLATASPLPLSGR